MKSYNVHEAKTHRSRLLEQAESGAEVAISRAGHPVARLQAIALRGQRIRGLDRGRVVTHRAFDDPLPDSILTALTPRIDYAKGDL